MTFDWANLPFSYKKTRMNVRCTYQNGSWGKLELHESEYIPMHIAATCLHYGQECFEGLKAYTGKDGKIRVFRWEENLKRINRSADYIVMPQIDKQLFWDSLVQLIKNNKEYIPPYGYGATFYIRPLLIGMSPHVGLNCSTEYLYVVFGTPVGSYFKDGFKPTNVIIHRASDRAAPKGTGHIKVGGNYAAGLKVTKEVKAQGYSSAMYLDPREKKYIDECGPANFFGIKDNCYVTPKSDSILPSITNMSLMELAAFLGMKVETRQIELNELESFQEAGQCGTAAVISPIGHIYDPDFDKTYVFSKDGKVGEISQKLYDTLTAIQFGEIEDTFGWTTIIE
ncbi:MAG: branched-chain amino acid aminotransferase [Bacteroidales bacterium]